MDGPLLNKLHNYNIWNHLSKHFFFLGLKKTVLISAHIGELTCRYRYICDRSNQKIFIRQALLTAYNVSFMATLTHSDALASSSFTVGTFFFIFLYFSNLFSQLYDWKMFNLSEKYNCLRWKRKCGVWIKSNSFLRLSQKNCSLCTQLVQPCVASGWINYLVPWSHL